MIPIKNRYTGKIIRTIEKIDNLREADLRGANLQEAYLRSAYLRGADLWGADLWLADLREAYLRSADLREANLRSADLREADLRSADLRGADLRSADLWGADLRETDYNITQMFLATWGETSDELCLELMRLDCEACPDGKRKFQKWIETNTCPFSKNIKRIVHFQEKKELWKPGRAKPIWKIWEMLAKEKKVKI